MHFSNRNSRDYKVVTWRKRKRGELGCINFSCCHLLRNGLWLNGTVTTELKKVEFFTIDMWSSCTVEPTRVLESILLMKISTSELTACKLRTSQTTTQGKILQPAWERGLSAGISTRRNTSASWRTDTQIVCNTLLFISFRKYTQRWQCVKGNSTARKAGEAIFLQLDKEGSTDGGTEGAQAPWAQPHNWVPNKMRI